MALDKTLKIYDDQGNEVDYDILAKDVKFLPDGKDLPTRLAELEDEIGEGGYTPPVGGIPKTDLAPDVQTSLGKADTALQTETDPTVPSWAKQPTKPTYTAQEVGALPANTPIPTKTSDLTNDSGYITEDDIPEGATVDSAMSSSSDNPVKNKVIKAYVDAVSVRIDTLIGSGNVQGAIDTFNEVTAFLAGISSSDTLAAKLALLVPQSRTINSKPLTGNVTIGMEDIQGLVDAINNAGSGAVSVIQPDPADGTFIIRVGDTDYTINLNHTHENMAKLIVCEESELPSTLEEDTIYGVEEDGEISVLYVGGIPFYGGGGGGTSTPVLRQPTDGSTIDVGAIASGESSVTKTITVKGKNLTQALTVAVTGTGYSVNKQTISAADANAGTTLTITCTSTADNAAGTLSIASSEVSCDCDLVANVETYETLRGVKLTGSQWMQTDYKPNANTEFVMTAKFTANANTQNPDAKGQYIFNCPNDGNKRWVLYNGATNDSAYVMLFNNEQTIGNQIIRFGTSTNEFVHDPVTISFAKDTSKGVFTFNGGTPRSVDTVLKTTTMAQPMSIGYHYGASLIYNVFDLTIYSIIITEDGNEVRHWVPKTKNGIPGLYDTVNGTFISSETSTELVAVPLT